MNFLGNLINYVSDENFMGGVAGGFGKETARQQERQDRDISSVREFAMRESARISQQNDSDLDDADDMVKQIAGLVAGDKSATSQEALEAAYFLIDTEGVSGALDMAKNLQSQYQTYRRDPLGVLGLESRDATSTTPLTSRGIASSFTKLRSIPSVKDSGIPIQKTAMDVIFNTPGPEETIQKSVESIYGTDQSIDLPTALQGKKVDSGLILGPNISSELERMYALQNSHDGVAVQNRDDSWNVVSGAIAENIRILKFAEDAAADKDIFTDRQKETTSNQWAGMLQSFAGLETEYDQVNNRYIATHKQVGIMQKAAEVGAEQVDLYITAKQMGLKGQDPETGEILDMDIYLFIKKYGITAGKYIEFVPADENAGTAAYLKQGSDVFDRSSPSFIAAIGTTSPLNTTQQSTVTGGGGGGGGQNPAVGTKPTATQIITNNKADWDAATQAGDTTKLKQIIGKILRTKIINPATQQPFTEAEIRAELDK